MVSRPVELTLIVILVYRDAVDSLYLDLTVARLRQSLLSTQYRSWETSRHFSLYPVVELGFGYNELLNHYPWGHDVIFIYLKILY